MISLITSGTQPLPAWRTPLRPQPGPAAGPETQPVASLPSLSEMRDAQKAMKKEMAARKVEAVRERRDALMLMVRIDPKAALKMTAELAKELRDAVKDYVDAGGKNVTDGEMAMMRRDAKDAREAADESLEGLPTEPAVADPEAVEPGTETFAPTVDAEMKRAQAAYATAFEVADGRDEKADRAEAVYGAAMADQGFFQQVKLAMGELKEAREKIRADWANPRKPSDEDWKAADKEMAELEKALDFAPTGMPEPLAAPASISA